MITLGQKHLICHQKPFSTKFRTKVTISCLQVVLGLLQPLDPDWWFLIPKNLGFRAQIKSVASSEPWSRPWPPTALTPCSRFTSPSTWVLALFFTCCMFLTSRLIWSWSQMIPPTPKHWFDTKITSQNQSFNFTSWGRSGPSTDPPPCSWPSDRSEAPESGLQWFPLLKNIQFDTKIVSLARSEPIENVKKIQVFVSHCAVYRFTAKNSAGLRDL